MEAFVGVTDEQLHALITPVSVALTIEGGKMESGALACALLAQMVLEYRRNRTTMTVANETLKIFAPFFDQIKAHISEMFPPGN
jgi:hypothetical protein